VLNAYRDPGRRFHNGSAPLAEGIIWIDLLKPTDAEKELVQQRAGVRIPTIEALSEIESSSRVAIDRGIISLSTPVVAGDDGDPYLAPFGLILTKSFLVTVRFNESPIVDAVAELVRNDDTIRSSAGAFIALLEAFVDQRADAFERLGADLERVSRSVFRGDVSKRKHAVRSNRSLRRILASVGHTGDRVSLARDALLGLERIAQFVETTDQDWLGPEFKVRLRAICRDIDSLNHYEEHLSNKVQFLLDAILGFITMEQNDLFKVLTIVSVVGIPPTLVAGIYGMNFKFMPELSWEWGYPLGLVVIVLSGILPLAWFKWRGWL
jgi:magnesium transporter